MDSDLLLVAGLGLGILAVPAILSALSNGRAPRAAAIVVMVATGLVVLAVSQKPSGYRIDEIPRVVIGVVNRLAP